MAYFNTTAPLQSDSSFQLPEKSIKAKVWAVCFYLFVFVFLSKLFTSKYGGLQIENIVEYIFTSQWTAIVLI
jgi:hypothetical protein